MESIFQAYFCLNKDIGNIEVLTELGIKHGLDRNDLLEYLSTNEAKNELQLELEKASKLNISAVPSVVIDSRLAFSGAQNPSLIKDILSNFAQLN